MPAAKARGAQGEPRELTGGAEIAVPRPRVRAAVLTFRGAERIAATLTALQATDWPDLEIVVIDNASEDGSGEIARRFEGVTVVRTQRNLGFPALNLALDTHAAEVICLLNDDVVVSPGWLSPLIDALREPGVGAAQPVLLYPGAFVGIRLVPPGPGWGLADVRIAGETVWSRCHFAGFGGRSDEGLLALRASVAAGSDYTAPAFGAPEAQVIWVPIALGDGTSPPGTTCAGVERDGGTNVDLEVTFEIRRVGSVRGGLENRSAFAEVGADGQPAAMPSRDKPSRDKPTPNRPGPDKPGPDKPSSDKPGPDKLRTAEGPRWRILGRSAAPSDFEELEHASVGGEDLKTLSVRVAPASGGVALVQNAGVEFTEHGYCKDRLAFTPFADIGVDAAEISAFTGGAVALSSEMLDQTGGLDEDLFLYYEDVDLSLRAAALGWRFVVVPESLVVHEHGATTGVGSTLQIAHSERNRLLVHARHRGARAGWAAVGSELRKIAWHARHDLTVRRSGAEPRREVGTRVRGLGEFMWRWALDSYRRSRRWQSGRRPRA